MSNTIKRIISAFVIMFLVGVVFNLGKISSLSLIGIIGVLILDELYVNFFKRKRKSIHYILGQINFLVPYLYFAFFNPASSFVQVFAAMALIVNFLLIAYLFIADMNSNFLISLEKKFSLVISFYILLPFLVISTFIHMKSWVIMFLLLLLVNFGMDTGAWFFGKNFGKNKLWPSVSPNKTVEGLVGGVFFSGIVGSIFWHFTIGGMGLGPFVFLLLLGLISHLGDLIQSKIKRQVGIKDSSSLIPGHGGVYDRMDSLIYIAPFFYFGIRLFFK